MQFLNTKRVMGVKFNNGLFIGRDASDLNKLGYELITLTHPQSECWRFKLTWYKATPGYSKWDIGGSSASGTVWWKWMSLGPFGSFNFTCQPHRWKKTSEIITGRKFNNRANKWKKK